MKQRSRANEGWLSRHEHDLAKGVALCQFTIRRLHIIQRIDTCDGDHYFALANRIGEVCQDADAVTIAVDGAAARGLRPIFCGASKLAMVLMRSGRTPRASASST